MQPRLGQRRLDFQARQAAAFGTSLEILVEVEGEDAMTGLRWPCVTAFVTYVAVDASLKPTSVPGLVLESEEEHALAAAAQERRQHRLSRRKRGQSTRP